MIFSKSVGPLGTQPGPEPKACSLGERLNLGKELTVQIHHPLGSVLSLIQITLGHRHIIKTTNLIKRSCRRIAVIREANTSPRKYILTTGGQARMANTEVIAFDLRLPTLLLSVCALCVWELSLVYSHSEWGNV